MTLGLGRAYHMTYELTDHMTYELTDHMTAGRGARPTQTREHLGEHRWALACPESSAAALLGCPMPTLFDYGSPYMSGV